MMRLAISLFSLLLAYASSAPCLAQEDLFPPAGTMQDHNVGRYVARAAERTSNAAAENLKSRVDSIIRANACGLEFKLEDIRDEMLRGNHEHQGEPLLYILIAKAQFIIESPDETCTFQSVFVKPSADDDPLDQWIAKLSAHFLTASNCAKGTFALASDQPRLTVTFSVDKLCMKRQINASILSMKKNGRLGSDLHLPLPCVGTVLDQLSSPLSSFPTIPVAPGGEWDTVVKELVRLLYMSTSLGGYMGEPLLEASTVSHMYEHLLSARGEVGKEDFQALADCNDTANEALGSPNDYADGLDDDVLQFLGDASSWLINAYAKYELLVLVGPIGVVPALVLIPALGLIDFPNEIEAPPFDLKVGESENHRLLIESSRYLTNAALIQELKKSQHENLGELMRAQTGVREWLLKDLQRIAKGDFYEYNARPYTRYSLQAVLNLYDFAIDNSGESDLAMRDAAHIVLDLSAAKFAAASNRGRRLVPYRRLANSDMSEIDSDHPQWEDPSLYETSSGADYEVVRAIILSGQTQLLDTCNRPGSPADQCLGFGLSQNTVEPKQDPSSFVITSVSKYRLPIPILEVAVERALPFQQTVRHAGIEHYYSSPAFTMSWGGIGRPPYLNATIFHKDPFPNDDGIAVPTSIIPTIDGNHMSGIFFFAGKDGRTDREDNTCGYKGFICGLQLNRWHDKFLEHCQEPKLELGASYMFINSHECLPGVKPAFFLAGIRGRCDGSFCDGPLWWGLMEVVDAPYAHLPAEFTKFKTERSLALRGSIPGSNGEGRYTSASGETIVFKISGDGSSVLAVDGRPMPQPFQNGDRDHLNDAFQTRGDVIQSENGRGTITSPWSGHSISFDFSDWSHPIRNQHLNAALSPVQLYGVNPASRDGALAWHKHWHAAAPIADRNGLEGPLSIGSNWDEMKCVTAGVGNDWAFGLRPEGDLFFYRHLAYRTGGGERSDWLGPTRIADGWSSFDKIIAGEEGVVYGLRSDGSLHWRRLLGVSSQGQATWQSPRDNIHPPGFPRFRHLFADRGGVLYGVTARGDLKWYQHLGFRDGASVWAPEKAPLARGWDKYRLVFGGGKGIIYAVDAEGTLFWFRHQGFADGSGTITDPVPIGKGWAEAVQAFALAP